MADEPHSEDYSEHVQQPEPDSYDDDWIEEPQCHTCGGDGWVDSIAEESGRHGWDSEGPGPCPNCRGSGLAKDCSTF